MAVRSNYIKSLMDSKKSFEKQYEEVLKESMKNIIGDNAKEEVRKLLKESEDEDSFTEEEVIEAVSGWASGAFEAIKGLLGTAGESIAEWFKG